MTRIQKFAGGGGAAYRQRERERLENEAAGIGVESTILGESGGTTTGAPVGYVSSPWAPGGVPSQWGPGYGRGYAGLTGLAPLSSQPQQIPYGRPGDNPATPAWPPEGDPVVGTDFAPGSIAEQTWLNYGIVDPSASEYDRWYNEEDPLGHMAADDPARQEYEGWDQQRANELAQRERFEQLSVYPERDRGDSDHRERLRVHKAKVSDILGGFEGGAVGYQMGGLAQAMRGRSGRNMRNLRRANDGRRPPPNRMRQMMAAKRGPMKSLGRPGGVRIGGPGGMPGGPGQFTPADAATPGGRAMPFRGFQQKQAMQQRGGVGQNRVGQSDQQGGLARALQRGTGRPPMSRRSAFPGQRQ